MKKVLFSLILGLMLFGMSGCFQEEKDEDEALKTNMPQEFSGVKRIETYNNNNKLIGYSDLTYYESGNLKKTIGYSEYLNYLDESTQHYYEAEYFDKSTNSFPELKTHTSKNKDSQIEYFFEINSYGDDLKWFEYEYDDNCILEDWTETEYSYTYNSNNKKTEKIEYEDGIKNGTTKYEYDEENRIINRKEYDGYEELTYEYTTEYNSYGDVSKEVYNNYNYSSSTEKRFKYLRNQDNQILEKRIENEDEALETRIIYEYYENGEIKKETTINYEYDYYGNLEEEFLPCIVEYDENGNTIKNIWYSSYSGNFSSWYEYEYNEDFRIKSIEKDEEGKIINYSEYKKTYNENNKLESITELDKAGNIAETTIYIY